MKDEAAVLGSPSLIVLMISVDVKQQLKKTKKTKAVASWAYPLNPCILYDIFCLNSQ